jgi:hypothetical protein
MRPHEEIYIDILNRIIENEKSLYGALAISIARKVGKLMVSNSGKVLEISDEPINIIRELIAEYKKLDGTISMRSIECILSAYKARHPDLDLPPQSIYQSLPN